MTQKHNYKAYGEDLWYYYAAAIRLKIQDWLYY